MENPNPTVSDLPYGPHARNELDFWQTPGEKPAPLFVWIHGGGFCQGGKGGAPADLVCGCLEAGISAASINYRLSQQAPFPACMLDGARAIQFLRRHAGSWGVDPQRISAGGGSAGAGISLWVAFHADLADAESDDPIARQSTRLTSVVTVNGQTSYDPNYIRSIIGGDAWKTDALQMLFRARPEEYDAPELRSRFRDGSPIHFATPDAPPVIQFYSWASTPADQDMPMGQGIHHPRFGEVLKEKLDSFGIECILRTRDDFPDFQEDAFWTSFAPEAVRFLSRHFEMKDQPE